MKYIILNLILIITFLFSAYYIHTNKYNLPIFFEIELKNKSNITILLSFDTPYLKNPYIEDYDTHKNNLINNKIFFIETNIYFNNETKKINLKIPKNIDISTFKGIFLIIKYPKDLYIYKIKLKNFLYNYTWNYNNIINEFDVITHFSENFILINKSLKYIEENKKKDFVYISKFKWWIASREIENFQKIYKNLQKVYKFYLYTFLFILYNILFIIINHHILLKILKKYNINLKFIISLIYSYVFIVYLIYNYFDFNYNINVRLEYYSNVKNIILSTKYNFDQILKYKYYSNYYIYFSNFIIKPIKENENNYLKIKYYKIFKYPQKGYDLILKVEYDNFNNYFILHSISFKFLFFSISWDYNELIKRHIKFNRNNFMLFDNNIIFNFIDDTKIGFWGLYRDIFYVFENYIKLILTVIFSLIYIIFIYLFKKLKQINILNLN